MSRNWLDSLILAAIGIFLITKGKPLAEAMVESTKAFWKKLGVKPFGGYGSLGIERWFLIIMGSFFLLGAALSLKGSIQFGE